MKKLLIGMTVAALLGLLAVPAVADETDATLTIEPYLYVAFTDTLGPPEITFTAEDVVKGYASDQFSFVVASNVKVDNFYYKLEAAVTDPGLADHCFFAFTPGASGWYNPRIPTVPSGFYQFMGGSMGLGSNLWLFGIKLSDHPSDYTDKMIGTLTITIFSGSAPASTSVDVCADYPDAAGCGG